MRIVYGTSVTSGVKQQKIFLTCKKNLYIFFNMFGGMKLNEATFTFRGWQFQFKPLRKIRVTWSDRKYTLWKVTIIYKNEVYVTEIKAFVPSACICRRLKNKLLLK